jgi:hypothetical protein
MQDSTINGFKQNIALQGKKAAKESENDSPDFGYPNFGLSATNSGPSYSILQRSAYPSTLGEKLTRDGAFNMNDKFD